jgi:uncharacterized BrkB/YihY/UPF0761 family membrane protein
MPAFDISLSWPELLKRTLKETNEDDCLGLAAQLAYYFFLALFPQSFSWSRSPVSFR